MNIRILLAIFSLVIISACGEENYIPKPKAYHRLMLPEKQYQKAQIPDCPFEFDIPQYASITKDTLFFNQPPSDPCWMDISFKGMNGKIHISYKEIGNQNKLPKLIEDAYKLTAKHIRKAEFIDDRIFHKDDVHGLIYDVGGDAASAVQFFLTDSTTHFLRGALYFQSKPNYDSIRPVVDFIKTDIQQMIDTFEWKE